MTAPSTVVAADSNRPHGHIAIGTRNGAPELTAVDTGDGRLEWWASNGGFLDAIGARALAAELILWADRQDARTKTEPLPGQLDLFGEDA